MVKYNYKNTLQMRKQSWEGREVGWIWENEHDQNAFYEILKKLIIFKDGR